MVLVNRWKASIRPSELHIPRHRLLPTPFFILGLLMLSPKRDISCKPCRLCPLGFKQSVVVCYSHISSCVSQFWIVSMCISLLKVFCCDFNNLFFGLLVCIRIFALLFAG